MLKPLNRAVFRHDRDVFQGHARLLRPGADHFVPGGLFRHLPGSAQDQPAFRTGQCNIQQALIFFFLSASRLFPRCLNHGRAFCARGAPADSALPHLDQRRGARRVAVGAVGQDHHRRLQPLRAMHRHHPDTPARAVGLTLDLDIVGVQPAEEAGQARHVHPLVGQRLAQQFVDPVLGLGPQPRQQPPASAVPRQHPLDQLEWPQEIRPSAQIVEDCRRLRKLLPAPAELLPQKARLPPLRQIV